MSQSQSDDPPDEFGVWFKANARCGNCVFFRPGLFEFGECVNSIVPLKEVPADRERCGAGYREWAPNEATRPAFDAALGSYLEWFDSNFEEWLSCLDL